MSIRSFRRVPAARSGRTSARFPEARVDPRTVGNPLGFRVLAGIEVEADFAQRRQRLFAILIRDLRRHAGRESDAILLILAERLDDREHPESGRASCRERGCTYG